MNPRPSERANAPSEVADRFADQLSSARGALRGYVRALAAGPGSVDPDDAVQEALTRAWTRRAAFDMERPLLPWLKRIALRAFLDLRRRPGETSALEVEPAANELPDEMAAQEEVQRLLDRLEPREAALLDRFHRLGEPLQSIAEDLGLPLGTAKSLLHRARRKLAEGSR